MKKNVAVGQVTFTHSSTIAEFNAALMKALKEIPEIKMQPNCPFVASSKIHFITNGVQNLRVDFEKQGATLYLRIIAESIGAANIEKDKAIILRIFEQLCKTCEELPYPKGKDGKVRRVKLTCEKDYRIEESWYESEPNSFGAFFRGIKEAIRTDKATQRTLLAILCVVFIVVFFGWAFMSSTKKNEQKRIIEQQKIEAQAIREREAKERQDRERNEWIYGIWEGYIPNPWTGGVMRLHIEIMRDGVLYDDTDKKFYNFTISEDGIHAGGNFYELDRSSQRIGAGEGYWYHKIR